MSGEGSEPAQTRTRDGLVWRIGTDADVSWINGHTVTGLTITSAIPPVFEEYATVVPRDDDCESPSQVIAERDRAVLALLDRHTPPQPWWLGYLDTDGSEPGFPGPPQVTLYADWHYVLVQAGAEQAVAWPSDNEWKNTRLPDLLFPQDRSWLLSTLWDDDWTCIGGPRGLIVDLLADQRLEARRVTLDQDATPPGHTAF